MAATNHERVGQALGLLSRGLAPFVARECQSKYGERWLAAVTRMDPGSAQSAKKVSPTDAQFLLKVIWDEWQSVFRTTLGQSERTYVSELRDVRNRWAHQDAFSGDDAYRSLDSVHRLLLAVSAADEAVEVDRMRQDLLRARFAEQARSTQRRVAVAPVEGRPAGGLTPWRELVTPHPDVASGRYQHAEFAADLHQVWRDEAAEEYGKPVEFFRRTFLTEGLRQLLLNAVRRWSGNGGDPVVELQTNFGGGKTHSLIALYHLAAGYPPHELPGVDAMLAEDDLVAPPPANTAVLVGQMISPGVAYDKGEGVTVRTLWGEMAWQLGGAEAYALVADADRTGTSPGAALVDLLRRYSPCLILIDEWVAYARQLYGTDGLPAGSFDAPSVSAELTRYLEEGWTPVIESDIDGPNALPLRLDRDNPSLGRYSATRRVARTIYLGSAPTQQAANRGIDDRSIKLGCVQPGESPATFGDALRRLGDQATYLYVDGARYWYSLQPSVTRLAQDRAASNFTDDDVDEEIRRRLATATRAGQRGDFANVHPAPRTPAEVPDEPEARLVVLGPEHPHSSKTADSPARVAAAMFLERRAAGDRLYRNMVVFLAADKARLDELRQGVREFLAWSSIDDDKETLNLDNFQRRQAEDKRSRFDDVVAQRIGETFTWLLLPSQSATDPTITWDETRVAGPDALAVRVSRKLKGEEALITEYSGVRLRMDLDRVPLWRGGHVGLRQLWRDYSQYLYLPRLRDSAVLVDAVRQGVALLTWSSDTFAYASAVDEASGRYTGLVAGEHPTVVLDAESVVVKAEVAGRQMDEERSAASTPPGTEQDAGDGDATGRSAADTGGEVTDPAGPAAKTRF